MDLFRHALVPVFAHISVLKWPSTLHFFRPSIQIKTKLMFSKNTFLYQTPKREINIFWKYDDRFSIWSISFKAINLLWCLWWHLRFMCLRSVAFSNIWHLQKYKSAQSQPNKRKCVSTDKWKRFSWVFHNYTIQRWVPEIHIYCKSQRLYIAALPFAKHVAVHLKLLVLLYLLFCELP